jgi:hypothetical protein
MKQKIVVLVEGFVIVGDVESDTSKGMVLVNASVIRVWGTTEGLGQLALKGRQSDTVLDPCGVAEIPKHAIVVVIPTAVRL